jgi:hypothetical protein
MPLTKAGELVALMSAGSLAIALIPDYAVIGVGAPALLVAARLVQGLSLGGQYAAADMYNAGGVGLVMRELLKAGLLHGDETTVDGRTIAKVAADTVETEGQPVVRTIDNPVKQAKAILTESDERARTPRTADGIERRRSEDTHACSTRVRVLQAVSQRKIVEATWSSSPRRPVDGEDAGRCSASRRPRGRGPRPVGRLADGRFSSGTRGLMISRVARGSGRRSDRTDRGGRQPSGAVTRRNATSRPAERSAT